MCIMGSTLMLFPLSAVMLQTGLALGRLELMEGMSVADVDLHFKGNFHFVDGHVSADMQRSGYHTRCSIDADGHRSCRTTGWAVAPVFPCRDGDEGHNDDEYHHSTNDCHSVGFVALKVGGRGTRIDPGHGKNCPNSNWNGPGLCAHTSVTARSEKNRMIDDCETMLNDQNLAGQRTLCENMLELGDAEEKASEGKLAGYIMFSIAATSMMCTTCVGLIAPKLAGS